MMAPAHIRRYYEECPYFGAWPEGAGVRTVKVGSLSAGEVLQLQVKEINNTVVDVRVKVYGCPYAIAVGAYIAEYMKGKTVRECQEMLTTPHLVTALKLPDTKIHSAVLGEQLIAALG